MLRYHDEQPLVQAIWRQLAGQLAVCTDCVNAHHACQASLTGLRESCLSNLMPWQRRTKQMPQYRLRRPPTLPSHPCLPCCRSFTGSNVTPTAPLRCWLPSMRWTAPAWRQRWARCRWVGGWVGGWVPQFHLAPWPELAARYEIKAWVM